MTWRVAHSLLHLRDQMNALHPKRSKASDGTVGDAAHASRSSDHNPWVLDGKVGVVTALDITNDPKSGCDAQKLANALVASCDPRIKYVISRGRIVSATVSPWVWRKYFGSNQHDKHVHISVRSEKKFYDDNRDWHVA
jgi:hypothetical protein